MKDQVLLWVSLLGVLVFAPLAFTPPEISARVVTPPTAIIVLENKSASKIVGNSNAPYLNNLIGQGTRFTNYKEGISAGPSLPDYLQLVAGSSCGKTDDSVTAPDPGISNQCPSTLWNQLENAGHSWTLYMDQMPTTCYKGKTYVNKTTHDQYALKHNPGPMFSQLPNCTQHVLPFGWLDPTNMPDVSFISPSICNDMHGSKASWAEPTCVPNSPALIRRGDNWVKALVPDLLNNGVRVFVTFDESGTLYAVAAGPGIPHATDGKAYTHFSWLAAIEDKYNMPRLRGAQGANALPI